MDGSRGWKRPADGARTACRHWVGGSVGWWVAGLQAEPRGTLCSYLLIHPSCWRPTRSTSTPREKQSLVGRDGENVERQGRRADGQTGRWETTLHVSHRGSKYIWSCIRIKHCIKMNRANLRVSCQGCFHLNQLLSTRRHRVTLFCIFFGNRRANQEKIEQNSKKKIGGGCSLDKAFISVTDPPQRSTTNSSSSSRSLPVWISGG